MSFKLFLSFKARLTLCEVQTQSAGERINFDGNWDRKTGKTVVKTTYSY